MPEQAIHTEIIEVENKLFVFNLRENARGRFLRVSEQGRGRYESIIIPESGLDDFKRAMDQMVAKSKATPPSTPEPEGH